MAPSPRLDPLEVFAELGRINFAETPLDDVLARISTLANRSIPGTDAVSVSLIRDGKATTPASTGQLASFCDEAQYRHGYGPCLEAGQGGETIVITDMTAESRWPSYTADAVAAGAGSSVSIGLPVQEQVLGALNLYATDTDAFDGGAIGVARTFAGYAGVALANAHVYESTARLAQQMQEAMQSRAVIEQAKGILIAQQGCTPAEAFDMLSRASQTSNRKLRDIAAAIVDGAQRKPQDRA